MNSYEGENQELNTDDDIMPDDFSYDDYQMEIVHHHDSHHHHHKSSSHSHGRSHSPKRRNSCRTGRVSATSFSDRFNRGYKQNKRRRRTKRSIGVKILIAVLIFLIIVVLGACIYVSAKWVAASHMKAGMFGKTPNESPAQALEINKFEEPTEEEIPDEYAIYYNDKYYEYNEDLVNILIMGIDRKGDVQEDTVEPHQADTLLLVTMDVVKKSVSVLCIPRDTVTDVQVYDLNNEYVKTIKAPIAVQHSYGDQSSLSDELTVEAVKNLLYAIPIYRYSVVDMTAIEDINDSVGGIELELLEDMTKWNPKMKKGIRYTLNGKDALIYTARRDTSIDESPMGRLERQSQYFKELFKKGKAKTKENILFPITVYNQLGDKVSSNLTTDEITYLARQIVEEDMDMTENAMTIPGNMEHIEEGTYEDYTYPMGYIVDDDALKELIISTYYKEVTEDYY